MTKKGINKDSPAFDEMISKRSQGEVRSKERIQSGIVYGLIFLTVCFGLTVVGIIGLGVELKVTEVTSVLSVILSGAIALVMIYLAIERCRSAWELLPIEVHQNGWNKAKQSLEICNIRSIKIGMKDSMGVEIE